MNVVRNFTMWGVLVFLVCLGCVRIDDETACAPQAGDYGSLRFTDYGTVMRKIKTFGGLFYSYNGSRFYAGGTEAGSGQHLSQLWIYNITKQEMTKVFNINESTFIDAIRYYDRLGVLFGAGNKVYRYIPSQNIIELITSLGDRVEIYDLVLFNDILFIGTAPQSELYEYNFTDKTLIKHQGILNQRYIRSIEQAGKYVYLGLGTVAQFIRVDIKTGEKQNLLPPEYDNDAFVYDIVKIDNLLLLFLAPSYRIVAYDTITCKFNSISQNISNMQMKMNKGDGIIFSAIGFLFEYNSKTNQISRLNCGECYISEFSENGKLQGFTRDGYYIHINTKTGSVINTIDMAKLGLTGANIIPYGLSVYNGRAFIPERRFSIFNTRTREIIEKRISAEPQASIFHNGYLWLANYTGAELRRYDYDMLFNDNKLKASNFNDSKYLIYDIENEQNRPMDMAAKGSMIAVTTMAEWGKYGGAITIFDTMLNNFKTIRNIVPRQTPMSLVFDRDNENILYIGTFAGNESGTMNLNGNAHLIKWDIKNNKVLFDIQPKKDWKIVDVDYLDGRVYLITGGAKLYALDAKTGEIVYSDNDTEIYRIHVVVNTLYAVTRTALISISAKNFRKYVIRDGFQLLQNLTHDEKTGYIYFTDQANLIEYRPGT